MWIALPDAFVSIVQHRELPDVLIVRARRAGDLEAFLGDAECDVLETPTADYPFRTFAARHVVAERLFRITMRDLEWDNFKSAADTDERHDFYTAVWAAGLRFERGGFRRPQRRLGLWRIDDPIQDPDDPDERRAYYDELEAELEAEEARADFGAEEDDGDIPF